MPAEAGGTGMAVQAQFSIVLFDLNKQVLNLPYIRCVGPTSGESVKLG